MQRACHPGWIALGLLLVAGCDESKRGDITERDAGTEADAAPSPDAQALDASAERDTGVLDASAGPNGGEDAGQATGQDAAGPDAAAPGLRAQICGDVESFPHPLPALDQRRAQAVGSATFGFLEGPVWIADQGVLLFSDMNFDANPAPLGPPGAIRRLTPPASFDTFVAESNSNGLALANDGALLAATHDTQALSRFALATGERSAIPVLSDGKRLNSPNDIAVRSDGTVYFTDPDWQLGPRTNETGRTGVYRLSPPLLGTENEALLVDAHLDKPNGIALSPDEQTLYVGSHGREIWKYPVRPDGSVGGRSKFAEPGPSEGLTVDCAGNLYVTSGAVQVFAPSGNKLGEVTLGGGPSNVAFGGPDRKTLYITAGPRLYAITLNVPGFPY